MTFVCPACKGALEGTAAAWSCLACSTVYPVVEGIVDFRLEPDPWLGIEEDRAKARALGRAIHGADLETAVRTYWAMTPETPSSQAERFVEHVLRAEQRSRQWLETLDLDTSRGTGLDLGCGTADLVAAAASRGIRLVGVDVALRWLVVARHRLNGIGVDAPLVCANAEHLPFGDLTFDDAFALGLIEHCPDKWTLFSEVKRVLRPQARFRSRTVNRFAITPEPHVGVWGVGWLPRRWADPFVRWRTGRSYGHHWPAGPGALRRALRRAGFDAASVEAASLLDAELAGRPAARTMAPLYGRARDLPVIRRALRAVAPLLEVEAVAA